MSFILYSVIISKELLIYYFIILKLKKENFRENSYKRRYNLMKRELKL